MTQGSLQILLVEDNPRDLKLGANPYIQKPVEFGSFRQAVKQLGLFWLVVNEPPPPGAFRS